MNYNKSSYDRFSTTYGSSYRDFSQPSDKYKPFDGNNKTSFTYSSPWSSNSPTNKSNGFTYNKIDSNSGSSSSKYTSIPETNYRNKYESYDKSYTNPKIANFFSLYSNVFNEISRINETLFLSGYDAITTSKLKQLGITLIVSAMRERPPVYPGVGAANLHISVDDIESANIKSYFDKAADRMDSEIRNGGIVLVHCMAGISRSTSLVLAYLMKYQKMSLRSAFNMVRSKRSCVFPNTGFWQQLIEYESRIFGSKSVNMVRSNGFMLPDLLANEFNRSNSYLTYGQDDVRSKKSPLNSLFNRLHL